MANIFKNQPRYSKHIASIMRDINQLEYQIYEPQVIEELVQEGWHKYMCIDDTNGYLYFSGGTGTGNFNKIWQYDLSDWSYVKNFGGSVGSIGSPEYIGNIQGIAVNPSNQYVYAVDGYSKTIKVFDSSDGSFQYQLPDASDSYTWPSSSVINDCFITGGHLYVLVAIGGGNPSKIEKFNLTSKLWVETAISIPYADVLPNNCTYYDGKVYLAKYRTVYVYDLATGDLDFSFGESGSGPGQMLDASGVATDGIKIHVIDDTLNQINIFTMDGTWILSYGATDFYGEMSDIAIDSDGYIYVNETGGTATTNVDQILIFSNGLEPGEMTPWYCYFNATEKTYLGDPNRTTIPSDNSLYQAIQNAKSLGKQVKPMSKIIIDMRDAIEGIVDRQKYWNPDSDYFYNRWPSNPDNLLNVAMTDVKSEYGLSDSPYDWTISNEDLIGEKMYDVIIGEIYECVETLKLANVAGLTPGT